MELSEMQARAAELEQLIADLPAGSRNISTTAGQRTRSGGRSIFRRMNWRIFALKSSKEKLRNGS